MNQPAGSAQPWFLYVVRCSDGTYYTGISTNVHRRIREHNLGQGARYTSARRPVTLQASWRFPDRRGAMQAEMAFKRKGRAAKTRSIQQAGAFREGCWALKRKA